MKVEANSQLLRNCRTKYTRRDFSPLRRWEIPHALERGADDIEHHAGGRGKDLSVQDASPFDAGNGGQQQRRQTSIDR